MVINGNIIMNVQKLVTKTSLNSNQKKNKYIKKNALINNVLLQNTINQVMLVIEIVQMVNLNKIKMAKKPASILVNQNITSKNVKTRANIY